MYKINHPLYLICETPLHAGSGSELGFVDNPIQREMPTGFPKIEGSTLKGSLRDQFEQVLAPGTRQHPDIDILFGPDNEDENADNYASSLSISDARLLLFPVKSMHGVFAWVTCPMVLNRLLETLVTCGIQNRFTVPAPLTASSKALEVHGGRIVLEAFTYHVAGGDPTCSALATWITNNVLPPQKSYWQQQLPEKLVVLRDDDFSYFVRLFTEEITRNKRDHATGTVKDGALFTEEYLPTESILYSHLMATPVLVGKGETPRQLSTGKDKADDVMAYFRQKLAEYPLIQTGGNASLGKGLIRTFSGWKEEEKEEEAQVQPQVQIQNQPPVQPQVQIQNQPPVQPQAQ